MKTIQRLTVFLLIVALLSSFVLTGNAVEIKKLYFTTNASTTFIDGGYLAHNMESVKAYGTNGIEFTGAHRIIWAFTNAIVEQYPYLYFKGGDKFSNCKKVAVTRKWNDGVGDKELQIKEGENCINLQELVQDDETEGFTYVTAYNGEPGGQSVTTNFEYIYLSNADQDGKVYEKPVQPTVPNGNPNKEVRYQLKSYAQDTAENGYGWLMSPDVSVTPDGKNGFTMQRKNGSGATTFNIAWVVPYEQLNTTPYLVVEVGNEGRANEGPKTDIFAYWEGVQGSLARFDLTPAAIGANSLNGVTKLPLKFAVDNVRESLHGDKGIAIIISVTIDERTDATTLEPLVVKNAYLLGYKDGGESEIVSSTTSSSEVSSDDTGSIPKAGGNGENNNMIIYIIIGIAALAVIAGGTVAFIFIRKKKI